MYEAIAKHVAPHKSRVSMSGQHVRIFIMHDRSMAEQKWLSYMWHPKTKDDVRKLCCLNFLGVQIQNLFVRLDVLSQTVPFSFPT